MKMERHLPAAVLAPFVKAYLIIESDEGMQNNTLPDTSVIMSFRFKGTVRLIADANAQLLPEAGITGLRRSARLLKYEPDTANLLVVFQEGGAAAFFKTPLHELFEAQQPLDDLIRIHKIKEVEEQLREAKDHLQRIVIIEQFLLSELRNQRPDLMVDHAVQQIKENSGNIKIKSLAAELYISQDAFEKRFRRNVGTTPKQFAAIVRLRHLLDHYGDADNLTDAAYQAGYFDQAHFIKDFKAFTGQTPQAFFQSAVWW